MKTELILEDLLNFIENNLNISIKYFYSNDFKNIEYNRQDVYVIYDSESKTNKNYNNGKDFTLFLNFQSLNDKFLTKSDELEEILEDYYLDTDDYSGYITDITIQDVAFVNDKVYSRDVIIKLLILKIN